MGTNQWIVTYMDGDDKTTEPVSADAWQIGPNGDLAFFDNGGHTVRPGVMDEKMFFVRAYAAGTWHTVNLFA